MSDRISRTIQVGVAWCLITAASGGAASAVAGNGKPGSSAAAGIHGGTSAEAPPFARVYLATRGCMSCSHCRTTIRQMLKPKTRGAETRLGDDQVEVKYLAPQIVPLRDVIQSLANSRLHDLSVVDVLFEADGVIRAGRNGVLTFVVAETGQPFSATIDPSAKRPADGTTVHVTSLVDGWRGKGDLSLRVREIRVKS